MRKHLPERVYLILALQKLANEQDHGDSQYRDDAIQNPNLHG